MGTNSNPTQGVEPACKIKPQNIRFGVLKHYVEAEAKRLERSVNWYVNSLVRKDLKDKKRI